MDGSMWGEGSGAVLVNVYPPRLRWPAWVGQAGVCRGLELLLRSPCAKHVCRETGGGAGGE